MIENFEMPLKDIIMTVAVILGPILAVQAQKYIERIQDKRNRRMALFKTLMSTRAERLNRDHVQALNMIDIEFYGRLLPFIKTRYQTKTEQAVTHAWKFIIIISTIKMITNHSTSGLRKEMNYLQTCYMQ